MPQRVLLGMSRLMKMAPAAAATLSSTSALFPAGCVFCTSCMAGLKVWSVASCIAVGHSLLMKYCLQAAYLDPLPPSTAREGWHRWLCWHSRQSPAPANRAAAAIRVSVPIIKIYCTLWTREAVMPNLGFWGNLGLHCVRTVCALRAHCVHIVHAEASTLTQEYLSPVY